MVTKQFEFVIDLIQLLQFIIQKGFLVTLGEAFRTKEQQILYVQQGKSKTLESSHLNRLAIDLNFFKDGKVVTDRAVLKPIGDFWEGLRPENRWGGSWRGLIESGKSFFVDCPHFERKL